MPTRWTRTSASPGPGCGGLGNRDRAEAAGLFELDGVHASLAAGRGLFYFARTARAPPILGGAAELPGRDPEHDPRRTAETPGPTGTGGVAPFCRAASNSGTPAAKLCVSRASSKTMFRSPGLGRAQYPTSDGHPQRGRVVGDDRVPAEVYSPAQDPEQQRAEHAHDRAPGPHRQHGREAVEGGEVQQQDRDREQVAGVEHPGDDPERQPGADHEERRLEEDEREHPEDLAEQQAPPRGPAWPGGPWRGSGRGRSAGTRPSR